MTRYAALSRDDVPENLAMMFITFPAAKDPTYEQRHPGTELGGLGGWSPICPPIFAAPIRSALWALRLLNPTSWDYGVGTATTTTTSQGDTSTGVPFNGNGVVTPSSQAGPA